MRVLLTAFEPYDRWPENSSWLALMELLADRPAAVDLVTRRYPVDFEALQTKLNTDLSQHYDAVLHLGQAPGSPSIRLEAIAVNVAGCMEEQGQWQGPLIESAPVAFRTRMPLGRWVNRLRAEQIPAHVSYHAGTFLCNATMYLSHYWHESRDIPARVGFVHLPLASEQISKTAEELPTLPIATLARAIRIILQDIVSGDEPSDTLGLA